jgi:hypothetical protein
MPRNNDKIARELYRTGTVSDPPTPVTAAQAARKARENARLLAAAPDMVRALEMVQDAYAKGPDPRAVRDAMDGAIDYVREAIQKARGE